MRTVVKEVLLALVLLFAPPARADSPEETQARMHYSQGQKQFEAGHFSEALSAYQRSYALSPYPAILYKIALCRDLLGQRQEAISAYREYLGLEALSERRAAVEGRIKELSSAPPAAPKALSSPEPIAAAVPSTARTEPTALAPAEAAPPPAARKRSRLWIVGVAVGAAAAIGIGVGLGVGLAGSDSVRAATYGTIAVR